MSKKSFSNFAFLLVAYTLLVIIWGAWVRISHSGDGCGDTWPLCHGQLIPEALQRKTWVEYAHRGMSGILGFLIFGFFIWAFKTFPKNHKVRLWATLSFVFTITEALLGAKIVLFKLVANNDSPYRAFIMALHLVNSLMLMASLALTWDFSRGDLVRRKNSPWSFEGLKTRRIVTGTLTAFLFLAVTGAIAALASTLFPASSLLDGLAADWDPSSHYLVRLRGLHPLLGLLFGGSLALTAWLSIQLQKPGLDELRKRSQQLAVALTAGVAFGLLTLLSLAPVWMKLVHLALAHTIWILLVLWIRELVFTKKD